MVGPGDSIELRRNGQVSGSRKLRVWSHVSADDDGALKMGIIQLISFRQLIVLSQVSPENCERGAGK